MLVSVHLWLILVTGIFGNFVLLCTCTQRCMSSKRNTTPYFRLSDTPPVTHGVLLCVFYRHTVWNIPSDSLQAQGSKATTVHPTKTSSNSQQLQIYNY